MNEEQKINKLPKEWKKVTLSEVATYINGKAFKPTEWSREGLPIIRIQNLNKEKSEFNYCNFKVDEKFFVNKGDLLFAWSGTPDTSFGAHIWKGGKAVLNQHIFKILIDKNQIEKQYYLYALNHKVKEFVSKAHGTAGLAHITKKKFEESEIYLPSKSTQQAIVSKIEELFSELDKGVENLRLAQQQLKTYRQSVLNTLVTGNNCQTIESVIKKLDQGWSPKCENEASTDKTEWAVIKTSAVQHGYFLEFENKRLPKELKPKEQHELMEGDILITRAGPRVRVGVCCMVRHTRPKLINCDKVYRIKVNDKIVTPEYFEFILNTPQYQDEIEKMKSGISDSGLNLTQKAFLQITIPVPTIKEQNKLVMEIESRLSVADKMEESIIQSLQQAEALRQSILKKAFEGKLISSKLGK